VPVATIALSTSAVMLSAGVAGCKKQELTAPGDAGAKGPILIQSREDIPVELGGKAAPYTPPQSANAPKPGAGGKAGSEENKAPRRVEPAPPASVVAITHNHPPDQPCQPLKREEVEKALLDLRSKPK
jgi:hypothetical protein